MSSKLPRFRLDFAVKVLSSDEASGTFELALIPDPRRYEWQVMDGKQYLYDKLDHLMIPQEVFAEYAKGLEGLPIYHEPQMVGDAAAYIEGRKQAIRDMLNGVQPAPSFEDKSEEFLQGLASDKLEFAALSIDIVGSTKLATTTDPEIYARVVSTILYELSGLIPKFRGHVLKYTGDGLLAYFPAPSFNIKNDLATDCALTLRCLVTDGLNPVFAEFGRPMINVRIGIDAGEAYVQTIGSPESKQHKDIIGSVVSLAAKIQAKAPPGEIFVGETAERSLHVAWREQCVPVEPGDDWPYKTAGGNPYKVFRLTGA